MEKLMLGEMLVWIMKLLRANKIKIKKQKCQHLRKRYA